MAREATTRAPSIQSCDEQCHSRSEWPIAEHKTSKVSTRVVQLTSKSQRVILSNRSATDHTRSSVSFEGTRLSFNTNPRKSMVRLDCLTTLLHQSVPDAFSGNGRSIPRIKRPRKCDSFTSPGWPERHRQARCGEQRRFNVLQYPSNLRHSRQSQQGMCSQARQSYSQSGKASAQRDKRADERGRRPIKESLSKLCVLYMMNHRLFLCCRRHIVHPNVRHLSLLFQMAQKEM